MTASDWNWRLEISPQDYPWDCAAASTAWALQTIGLEYSEQDVIAGLGPSRISPTYGLLDASGAGLVQWLGEIGVVAQNNPASSWDDVVAAAGYQPLVMGGRAWYHWVGVRMGGICAVGSDIDYLAIANSAAGWMGIGQSINSDQFEELGTFSAVWFTQW